MTPQSMELILIHRFSWIRPFPFIFVVSCIRTRPSDPTIYININVIIQGLYFSPSGVHVSFVTRCKCCVSGVPILFYRIERERVVHIFHIFPICNCPSIICRRRRSFFRLHAQRNRYERYLVPFRAYHCRESEIWTQSTTLERSPSHAGHIVSVVARKQTGVIGVLF